MLFTPKYNTYDDAVAALEVAKWLYSEADREYREYFEFAGNEKGDKHAKFLYKQVKSAYRNLEKTLAGIRQSGFSQLATNYLLVGA